jgi:hypothetical protein
MRYPRFPRLAFLAIIPLILALFLAAPLRATGYTVVFTDGKSLVIKEKFKVQNGRAIFTQLNGTQTWVPVNTIDQAKTDAANRDGYGIAVVLPGAPQDVGPPPAQLPRDRTLKDLIATREAGPREIASTKRTKPVVSSSGMVKTKAGYVDLGALPRRPYSHPDISGEMHQFFRAQGIEEVEIYEGTQADRPLVEISTNSEGSVFKALTTSANALLHVRDTFQGRISAFDLLLMTPARERAGQFVLTPELATDLVSRKVEVAAFFLRNVQF